MTMPFDEVDVVDITQADPPVLNVTAPPPPAPINVTIYPVEPITVLFDD